MLLIATGVVVPGINAMFSFPFPKKNPKTSLYEEPTYSFDPKPPEFYQANIQYPFLGTGIKFCSGFPGPHRFVRYLRKIHPKRNKPEKATVVLLNFLNNGCHFFMI